MKFETFFENFELLTDAPNATVKLREIILQLAVRGKIIRQELNDEPASCLLQKIDNEQGRIITDKVSKKEEKFNIPASWEWVYFDRILNRIHYGYTASANHELLDVRLLRITDIQNNTVDWESVPGCEIKSDEIDKFKLQNGDLLIARTGGTIGKSFLVESISLNSVFASYLIRAVPSSQVFPKYIKIFLDAPLYWEQLYTKSMGTGQPNVNATSLKSLVVPLPPLAEQKRIVEKCDRLLSICDEIEKRQQQKQESIVRMNESAIAQLLSSQNPDDFRQHWQRICNNFDLLYSVPETIPKLRQAILQLAVQGKLVSQDPNDEPASVLLEKIKLERKRLLEETTFREPKDFKPIHNNEILFELPKEWMWSRIGELFLISSGTTPNRLNHKYFEDGTEYWVKTTDLNNETVLTCEEKITKQAVLDCNLKYYPVGTVCVALYGGAGTIGKSGLLGIETTINQSVCGIYPNKYVNAKYLHLYIKLIRPLWMNFAASLRKAPNINAGVVNNMVFPLPPLAEQKRIVEKCDRLMSLCDTLEAKLKQGRESSEKLMEVAARQVLAN